MLSLEEGIQAVKLAREAVERYVKNNQEPLQGFEREFEERQGAFVTLNTYPERELRGCIGVPLPVMPLREAIIESAESATRDPRFPPLKEAELDRILVEVTILTKPELIEVKQPQDYPLNIEIGRDGLIVEQGFYKGLLLPQVPVEQGWDKEEFLSHTCMKAGLLPDAWFDKNTKISRFGGQIFTEIKPRGEIKEKTLDGTNN